MTRPIAIGRGEAEHDSIWLKGYYDFYCWTNYRKAAFIHKDVNYQLDKEKYTIIIRPINIVYKKKSHLWQIYI